MPIFHSFPLAQKLILGSIAIVTISVVAVSIYTLINLHPTDTTGTIQSYISTLSATYYEDYFFPDLESSIRAHTSSDISEILSEYTDTGFAKVPLRQILLHTDTSIVDTSLITDHCDTNTTLVHFFPEPPFTATSYHTSYDYACNF
ncbi:hypothetical protein IIY66_01570 [Candidatus Saccharibacteria bacterium]|nr:hypothetical protein [Candidatus Saccharibacteria bacterium]